MNSVYKVNKHVFSTMMVETRATHTHTPPRIPGSASWILLLASSFHIRTRKTLSVEL